MFFEEVNLIRVGLLFGILEKAIVVNDPLVNHRCPQRVDLAGQQDAFDRIGIKQMNPVFQGQPEFRIFPHPGLM